MKLPRDISGLALAHALRLFGYAITRQTGSHVRLTTTQRGEHHVTVPNHPQLKVGTLSGILGEVADHFELDRDAVGRRLFEG